jgi:magnesium chelatase subunit D
MQYHGIRGRDPTMQAVEHAGEADSARVFPFSAIVGQTAMKRALTLAAIHPGLGGVLIRGTKGAAKSTAVRALSAILPDIAVYPGDPFLRAPGEKVVDWPLPEGIEPIERPVSLVNLPVGATEDRVVGSLNLERALSTGVRSFEPGLLAAAHRGILYIDEVNLLGDHLVDLLLDAAAMGVNHVEREGLTFRHPARFVLVGTMNPEEGDLRPQLLDRFGLAVDVEPMTDPTLRAEVVRRRLAFEADPAGFRKAWAAADRKEGQRISEAQKRLPQVIVPDDVLEVICTRCAVEGAEGLRADITIFKAASALAAYEGRTIVCSHDVDAVAELGLSHRRTTHCQPPKAPPPQPPNHPNDREPAPDDRPRIPPEREYYADRSSQREAKAEASAEPSTVGDASDLTQIIQPADPQRGLNWAPPPPKPRKNARIGNGRRGVTGLGGRRGVVVRSKPSNGRCSDPAIAATLRSAAPWQVGRGRRDGQALLIRPHDLRDRVRKAPARNLVLFVVDASRSMGARRRMAESKAAILSLLVDAYQRRDLVGMVTFGGTEAHVTLPPTRSVRTAAKFLAELPIGGLTPLARGLQAAETLVASVRRRDAGLSPLLVLLTDGRGNVPLLPGGDPCHDAITVVRRLAAGGVQGLVIDTESGPVRLGRARAIAEAWSADLRSLSDLTGHHLPATIRQALLAG